MNKENHTGFDTEIESIFSDCQDQIKEAIRLYEQDIQTAIDELKRSVSENTHA